MHYKDKYSEYKQKLRKANANIATLTARIAKFDMQLAAEKEDRGGYVPANQGFSDQNLSGYNLQELMNNDGLNEEIKKLLAENQF